MTNVPPVAGPHSMEFRVGGYVAVAADREDSPDTYLWRGHPGEVYDVAYDAAGQPWNISVGFVGGPYLGGTPEGLGVVPIDKATYLARGDRVVAGLHPVDDREIPGGLMAPGSEWPGGRRPS